MRVKSAAIGVAVLMGGLASVGLASIAGADTLGLLRSVDDFIVGRKPADLPQVMVPTAAPASTPEGTAKTAAGIEKSAAVNGSLYAVVAPVFKGAGGTTSYLRLFNGGAGNALISVTLVGEPSGVTVGTANITLASRVAQQFAITDLTALIPGGGTIIASDTSYAIYLQSAEPTAGYQHVIYNAGQGNGIFENVSVCKTLLNTAIAGVANSLVLMNVHSSLFDNNYPSQIEIHNYWNAAITYKVTVIDAATGTVKGQVNIPTAANTSYSFPSHYFEQQVGWAVNNTQLYMNLVLTDVTGAVPTAVVGQSIVNNALAATINMSTACAINNTTTAGGGGGGFGGGGISY